jgi:hypothetical protein
MRETEMSRRGIGFVAANGSGIKNYGEKMIVGYIDDGGAVSMKVHCAGYREFFYLHVVVMDALCKAIVGRPSRSPPRYGRSGRRR